MIFLHVVIKTLIFLWTSWL